MTYEKKYRIARAGLDHLERAFVEMSKAHKEIQKVYENKSKIYLDSVNYWYDKYQEERAKTWWQKLKETIKSKYQ